MRIIAHVYRRSVLFVMLIGLGMFLGVHDLTEADIYKWRDSAGVIYYSNHPPADLSSLIEIIPSEEQTPGADDTPKVYYFSGPDGQTGEDFTVPPDVLEELFDEHPQAAAVPPASPAPAPTASPDLTALTVRLTEIERALQQEADSRKQWQRQYAEAQTVISALEEQNQTLTTALADMQDEVEWLRDSVAASDMHVAALNDRLRPGDYAMLEDSLTEVRQQVRALTAEFGSVDAGQLADVAQLSEHVAALRAGMQSAQRQQDYEYALHLRLETLERNLEQLADSQFDLPQAVQLVSRVETQGTTLKTVSARQNQRLEEQQRQIAALEAELARVRSSSPSTGRPLAAPDAETQTQLAQVREENQFLKGMLKHQAQTLTDQEARIQAIQAQLNMIAGPGAAVSPTAGIQIVPRLERRKLSFWERIGGWLSAPQSQDDDDA